MRVAIVSAGVVPVPPVRGGAVENTIDTIIRKNSQNSTDPFSISVYSIHDDKACKAAEDYADVRFHFFKVNRWAHRISSRFSTLLDKLFGYEFPENYHFLLQVCRHLSREKPDVVIVHNRSSFMPLLKKRLGARTVLYLHNDYLHSGTRNGKSISAASDLIITNSHFIEKRALAATDRPGAIKTLHNCIDLEAFSRGFSDKARDLRQRLDIPANDVIVSFVGRLEPLKGLRELASAFAQINSSNITLLICGSAPSGEDRKSGFLAEIEKIMQPYQHKVRFTGYVPYGDMPVVYAMSDILVAPSMWDEPAGKIVIEAMASRTALIITNSGGMPEYIDRDHSIVVERDGDIERNIAEGISRLAGNSELRRKFVEASFSYVQKFGQDEYYRKYKDIIRGLSTS